MQRYLLDSGPAQDFLFQRRGIQDRVINARQGGAKIGICTPVLGEIIAGLEGSQNREHSRAITNRRLCKLICWPYDITAAYEFGRIMAHLRRMRRPMQQVDIQIAAIALTLGHCTIVTGDSDFSVIPGVAVENWSNEVQG
jgi:tRNA(fMet)-specific endonuclease VapC